MDTITPTEERDDSRALSLLYLASPALPIGAFAYSQGLEKAIDAGRVADKVSLRQWCLDAIRFGLVQLDMPVLRRLYQALTSGDMQRFAYWNDYIFACRETYELYEEERQLGASLRRLVLQQGLCEAEFAWPERVAYLSCFAVAGKGLGLDDTLLLTAFVWSWLENQVAVAGKAVPIGQSDAQSVLLAIKPDLATMVKQGLQLTDAQLSGSLPGLAIHSALHETQYSRLFRS